MKQRCKDDTWFGFKNFGNSAHARAKLKGSGIGIISFGNCGEDQYQGIVEVKIDGTSIQKADAAQGQSNTFIFRYEDSSVLQIEERGYGIIKLWSLDFLCEGILAIPLLIDRTLLSLKTPESISHNRHLSFF